jgi:hypothetical protein
MFDGEMPVIGVATDSSIKTVSAKDKDDYAFNVGNAMITTTCGFIMTPEGMTDIYLQTKRSNGEFVYEVARNGDICIDGEGLDSKVYQWFDSKWNLLSVVNMDIACKGPKECAHVQYKEECTGNSYIDSCVTNDNGNCFMVNDLQALVEEHEDDIDVYQEKILLLELSNEKLRKQLE